MSVAVSPQVCSWCLGDMRPVDGVPSLMVCVYCGRALSFKGKALPLLLPASRTEAALAVTAGAPAGSVRAPRAA